MSTIPSRVRFGHVKEDIRVNRSNRTRITQADRELYPKLKAAANQLDAFLAEAGLDTGKSSQQLKLSVVWPNGYIQLSVANDETKRTVLPVLETFGALQDPQKPNLFVYDGQKIHLQTGAEADYQNGLPFTFLAKKFRQAKTALREKLGFLTLPC